MTQSFVIMGVTACGKTTIGRALSERLSVPFFDGDDFHPNENIEKMASGTPLADHDRLPWLQSLNDHMCKMEQSKKSAIYACSALKHTYRDILAKDMKQIQFIYLQVPEQELLRRLQLRQGHFMKGSMLGSQLRDLEEPPNAMVVPVIGGVACTLEDILSRLPPSSM